ncbi:hypothetical protein SAMN05216330_12210 [Bradyrhizobium sp. Ghvi]|nr:hypothetical protein SAMN05216330_12210 [Bradyrhizobium sp. Ghvi]
MRSISADTIPIRFWQIRYDQNRDPDTPTLPIISDSSNCQNFAYGTDATDCTLAVAC